MRHVGSLQTVALFLVEGLRKHVLVLSLLFFGIFAPGICFSLRFQYGDSESAMLFQEKRRRTLNRWCEDSTHLQLAAMFFSDVGERHSENSRSQETIVSCLPLSIQTDPTFE